MSILLWLQSMRYFDKKYFGWKFEFLMGFSVIKGNIQVEFSNIEN